MNFLSPFFLVGALAVAGPIVFHLIRRTTRQRSLFSSVMFLSPTAPRLTQRSRLEHWLLLLLRCAALALLVLGFARPFWRKTVPLEGAAAESRRVVVLVDVSASMRRTGLWAQARERATAVLRSIGPGDQAAVFTFSRKAAPLVSFEAWNAAPVGDRVALVTSRLAATTPGWDEDHLGDALITAAEALTEGGAENKAPGPRQIFLVSDLKAGSHLDSLPAFDWPKTVELRLEAVKATHSTNAGVQLIADSPDADRDAAPTVRVRVSNAADSTREQFSVGWSQPQGAGYSGPPVDIYVPPGQSRVVALPVPPSGAARQIMLKGDDEDFDNTLYVAKPERQRWSVLYFGAEGPDDVHSPRFFLEHALPDNPHLTVAMVARDPAAAVAPAELTAAKVFFATEALPAEVAGELRAQLLAGKTMLFAPRSAAAAGTLARLLDLPSVSLEEAHPSDYAMFGDIDFRHPMFAPFADPHYSDFTKIHIWKYRRLKLDGMAGARVVARFDRGDPGLVEVPVGAGRLMVLLTGWNPSDSQLAISSKFVPMVSALLEYAGGTFELTTQYTVGDILPKTIVGGSDALPQTKPGGSDVLLGNNLSAPGIYKTDTGQVVAVNLAASESRTEPMAPDELERYGAPGPKAAADPVRAKGEEALLQAAEAEGRQKLWRWLLGATLIVLLIESVLAGWTARHDRSGGSVAAPEGASP